MRAWLAVALILFLSPGCGDDSGASPGPADGGAEAACARETLPLQNPRAHVLGETFYLPPLGPACPDGARWEIAAAPAGSLNQVYMTGAPQPRFTPEVAGRYQLRVAGVDGSELELTAVARTAAERFRSHQLTPLYGAARVGDEIWTANGATYSVTRVIPDGPLYRIGDEIRTGSWPAAVAWREPLAHVLVAQRGSDTVGFIDRERGVLEDALWVGDEPTGLAISTDAALLYVSLPTMGQVAVVDLERREVADRIQVGFDPRALALSDDGRWLYAASYRSGNPEADDFGTYPGPAEDVWVIDTGSHEVAGSLQGIASVHRALQVAGGELYVTGTDGDPVPSTSGGTSFVHQVVAVAADPDANDFGQVRVRADLTNQPSSTGPVVNPSGVLIAGDHVWVSAESSGTLVRLDRDTLEETARVEVGPGARQLVSLDDGVVAVHAYESLELWIVDAVGEVVQTLTLAEDARPAEVALGERVFNRPGADYAANHACSSCHVETQNEGMIWRFGPEIWHNVRPLQLLAATPPLEWGAYVSSTENFGYQGPSSIVARPATPDEARALDAFLASLLGAPRANGHTRLDGSYTEAALRGQALFEGKATCSTCHVPPLYTNRALIDEGKSGEPADVPSLLGVYRHGIYFVRGQARDLDTAAAVALDYVDIDLTDAERADLVAFLRQLTPKGSHPLAIWPDRDSAEAVPAAIEPWVEFADPVDGSQDRPAAALAAQHVTLETETGDPVPGSVMIEGRRIWFRPDQPLAAGARYRFVVAAGLPFENGGRLVADRSTRFEVANPPAGDWPDRLTMTVTVGGPMGPSQIPLQLTRLDREDNGDLLVELRPLVFGSQQRQELWVRIDGDTVHLEPFALPISPGGVANAAEVVATVQDTAGGTIRALAGTLRLGGPGIDIPGVPFTLELPAPQ